jgi:hypothetical protein
MEAKGWRQLLFDALKADDTKRYAARVLGEKFSGRADEEVVAALSGALVEADPGQTIAAVCSALIAVGGDQAMATVERWSARTPPWDRMRLRWQLRGWTLDDVRAQILQSGLLTEQEYNAAKAKMDQEEPEQDGSSPILGLLSYADRLLMFDVETGELPCRHDDLLHDFAGISGGVFQPLHVSQQWRNRRGEFDDEADYTLRFVFAGRRFEVHLRNYGDWYDVERLVGAANAALAAEGRQERFVALYSGDQTANFTFGSPAKLNRLAESLALPIEADLSRAMREGKGFEQRVLEHYRQQGEMVD